MTLWNRVTIAAAPATPVDNLISLDDLKAFAGIDGDEAGITADLTRFLKTAVAMIDGPQGIGYALLTQDWCLTLDHFVPCIHLPGAPIKSVQSIKYDDPDGTEQTLDPELYHIDLGTQPVRLTPAYRKSWPITRAMPGSVRITYRLGEEDGTSVHPRLIDFICLVVSTRDKFREAVTATPSVVKEIPYGISSILDDFRQNVVTA